VHRFTVTYHNPYALNWYREGGFPPGTFQNTEAEVSRDQADEIRAELVRVLHKDVPLIFGKDWKYTPVRPECTIVIEAGSYSVSREGTAHFYRNADCVASVAGVLTVIREDDSPGEQEGSGGAGRIP
jgi:hypothetical protein